MSAPTRPQFQPIALGTSAPKKDIDKMASAARAYAQRDNIPVLTHPRDVKPAGEGATTMTQPDAADLSSATVKRFERFTVELPTYLYEDIKKRLATKKQTKKSITLNAFHAAGFYVAPEDLIEDGRRGK